MTHRTAIWLFLMLPQPWLGGCSAETELTILSFQRLAGTCAPNPTDPRDTCLQGEPRDRNGIILQLYETDDVSIPCFDCIVFGGCRLLRTECRCGPTEGREFGLPWEWLEGTMFQELDTDRAYCARVVQLWDPASEREEPGQCAFECSAELFEPEHFSTLSRGARICSFSEPITFPMVSVIAESRCRARYQMLGSCLGRSPSVTDLELCD